MNKKAIKYIIILLLVPLIASFIIAIATDNKGFSNNQNSQYNGIDIPDYNTNDITKEVKRSNTFIYFSVFSLIFISGGVFIYVKSKRGL